MKTIATALIGWLLLAVPCAAKAQQPEPAPRVVALKAADGMSLKATYFAAAKPGPGALLLHQNTRTRKSWESVAQQLAAAGINVLTLDLRGFGESGTPTAKLSDEERRKYRLAWPDDVDAALEFLRSQPGVGRNMIGAGGAGWLGVTCSVDAARRHPELIKSLVLMSGETMRDGLQFLHRASQLPELFVFSDDDEYPPTQDAMKLLYVTSSSSSKRLVHYSQAENAPWRWYESSDAETSGKVRANGGHGTDMFPMHPELPGIIVHWFVTTLVKTPGHAPADALAAAPILNQLQSPGGAAQVTQQLLDARRKDPQAQLWPEVAVDIIGEDFQRVGDIKNAIDVFRLNLVAYPESADAHFNLAAAYLADGQKDLAHEYGEKALAMIDSHKAALSSWSDTEERRAEIRRGVEDVLKQTGSADRSSGFRPGSSFRDCPECPEMIVIPSGHFLMGSSDAEKSWAASHGGTLESVADEAPQHRVSVPSFAIGKYDVTRGEYAAFVRETKHPAGDGCYVSSMPRSLKQGDASWENPSFAQTDRDPAVCVNWNDARAYVEWLNKKIGSRGGGTYRLPSESEWEYAARAGTSSKFWWGDDDAQAAAHAWYKDNSGDRTHPVGSKPPNAFRLSDMVGNVWQWTEDCYAESYAGAPTDGQSNEAVPSDKRSQDSQGKCLRVDRGSSWLYAAWLLRSATRERNPADFRDRIMGFRVAKTLP